MPAAASPRRKQVRLRAPGAVRARGGPAAGEVGGLVDHVELAKRWSGGARPVEEVAYGGGRRFRRCAPHPVPRRSRPCTPDPRRAAVAVSPPITKERATVRRLVPARTRQFVPAVQTVEEESCRSDYPFCSHGAAALSLARGRSRRVEGRWSWRTSGDRDHTPTHDRSAWRPRAPPRDLQARRADRFTPDSPNRSARRDLVPSSSRRLAAHFSPLGPDTASKSRVQGLRG